MTDSRCEPSSGAGTHFPMSFLGALLPACEQVDSLFEGSPGTERPRSQGLCYHMRPRRAHGEHRGRGRKPRQSRGGPRQGCRGRPEGALRLTEGCGLEGGPASVGEASLGAPGGSPSSPTPLGKDLPKGTGSFSVPHNVENINGLFGIVIATTFFKKYPAFYCMLDVVRLTSIFPTPTQRKGKESCSTPWHFFN